MRELRSAVEQALLLAPGSGDRRPPTCSGAARTEPAPRRRRRRRRSPSRSARPRRQWSRRSSATSSSQALRRHGGNISKAAEEVGMYRQNFQQKMRELGISADEIVGRSANDRPADTVMPLSRPSRRAMHILTRVTNLVRGTLAQWIGRREHRNPAAVYEAAIQERLKQYETLRDAAAGVLYLRGKLARELETASRAAGRTCEARLELAVDRDDDASALASHHAPRRVARRGRSTHRRADRAHRRSRGGEAEPDRVPGRDRPAARREGAHAGAAGQRQARACVCRRR